MRLVIHMGATKTASTYLQRELALNQDVLAEHGILVPRSGRRAKRVGNHHNIAWQFLGDRRFRKRRGDWDDLMTEIHESDAEIAVLSSEGFARLASSERMRTTFVRKLAEASDQIELLYVVREPLARINSMYTQAVKTFGAADRFVPYAEQALKSGFYDLDRAFRFWYQGDDATFTAIRFDEFVEEGPLQRLLRALDVKVPEDSIELPSSGQKNVSPGPLAVEGMRLLGASLRVMDWEFDRRSKATTAISKLAQSHADKLGWFKDKYWGWDRDHARDAMTLLADSNERFAQAVWNTSWPFPSPAKTPITAINLADVPPRIRGHVRDYVDKLIGKYMQLLRED